METNKPFPPSPEYKLYAYPIIPNSTIKKFLNLYSSSVDRWIPQNTESYDIMNTFRHSFAVENLEKLVDTPNEQEFNNLLETNPEYAPSNGGMQFLMLTPVYMFFSWLRGNLYEGPPPALRGDYEPDTFDEQIANIIGSFQFQKARDIYNRMVAFVENSENQTKEDFIRLSRDVFCMPLGNDWACDVTLFQKLTNQMNDFFKRQL